MKLEQETKNIITGSQTRIEGRQGYRINHEITRRWAIPTLRDSDKQPERSGEGELMD